MARLVSIDGIAAQAGEAVVSAYDHGFLYGDGVYETLRTYSGEPFLLEGHIARLERSARRIRIDFDRLPVRPAAELRRTLAASRNDESLIRLVITRGVGSFGYAKDQCPRPSLIVYVQEFEPPPEALYEKGASAVLVDVRRNPSVALDPYIKSINLLNNILASMEAEEKGANEGLMFNVEGELAEGSNTNVFIVKDGRALTPPLSAGILDGLTREFVLQLCRNGKVPCAEQTIRREDLASIDECFLTGTTKEVMPVTRIDGRPVGEGRPGPLTLKLLDLFRGAVSGATQTDARR